MRAVEQIAGAGVFALVLVDVFLTVLYARIHAGIVSQRMFRGVWKIFVATSKLAGEQRAAVLAYCGPAIVVCTIALWALLLVVGNALIFQPELGHGIRTTSGRTSTDFFTAMYAAGSSIATIGPGDLQPRTKTLRMLYLFDSFTGMSVMSLTIAYLMQIYSAVLRRNQLGLELHLLSGRTGDAAELLARLAPEGRFETAYNHLLELASEMTNSKESHHFYPVLFYFRFREEYYSVSRTALISLDAVTLLRSAVDNEQGGWIKNSAAVCQLADAASLMVRTLEDAFLPGGAPERMTSVDPATGEVWRARYFAGVQRLREAGIRTREADADVESYIRMRAGWHPLIAKLAPRMAYGMEQIDPAGTAPMRHPPTRPSAAAD